MPIVIRQVESEDDLIAACRLRYQVLVEEMGRKPNEADFEQGLVRDSLDQGSVTIIACDGDSVVGTQRVTLGSTGLLETWAEFFEMSQIAKGLYSQSVSMSSKLAVLSEYRKSTVPMRLAVRCYELASKSGSCIDFACAKGARASYLAAYGYRVYGEPRNLDGVGEVNRYALRMHDNKLFSAIRSPLRKHSKECSSCDGILLQGHGVATENRNVIRG